MSFYDEYIIKQSDNIESETRQETRTDLQLSDNKDKKTGNISGTVKDVGGIPVANATVKLNTSTLVPYTHVNTNAEGVFTITKIAVGSYVIAAIKEGYFLSDPISITVVKKKTTIVNIELIKDSNADKNIVFGVVKSGSDFNPIQCATVQLFEKEEVEDVFKGIASTNEQGQYLFADLDDGEYYINASKIGFTTTETPSTEISDKQYLVQDVILPTDSLANKGVICGIITDKDSGNPINDAVVALYQIEEGVENVIRLTKTNYEGKYLFGEIDTGEYRIKSTLQVNEV